MILLNLFEIWVDLNGQELNGLLICYARSTSLSFDFNSLTKSVASKPHRVKPVAKYGDAND